MSIAAMKAIKDTLGLLRLKAIELHTQEGSSQGRHLRIAWTTLTASTAKLVAAAAMFVGSHIL